jgi:ABC-2 type transport system permease protein
MKKFWRVIAYEYTRHVLRKRFIFAILSVPFFALFMIAIVVITFILETNTTPIGYVDHSGLLANPLPAPKPAAPDKPVPVQAFASEEEARSALQAGDLQAYYVLESDYLDTSRARLVYIHEPKRPAREQFTSFIAVNLLANYPPEIATRVIDGDKLIVRSPDGKREMSSSAMFSIMLPFIAGIAFFMAIFTSAGYIMQAVVEEKENRTMEIVVTSVSPNQLMMGKTLADIAIGLTQLLSWILILVVPVWIARPYIPMLSTIAVPPESLLLILAVMLPTFVMLGGLMAAIGATVTESREGQQIVGLFTMPTWIPYFLIYPLMSAPNSPLAVVMSFIPFTSPLTLVIRSGFTVLPFWQIALGVIILVACAAGSLWLAGRAFRLGMLSYGKRLPFLDIFRRQVHA